MDAANAIKELSQLDILGFCVTAIIIMATFVLVTTLIGKFSEIIKKPVFWVKNKNKDHELLLETVENLNKLSKRHQDDAEESRNQDVLIKENLNLVTIKLDGVSKQIADMQQKIDETEMAKLKDTIITYYKKYKEIGEWSQLEHDAFWGLFARYEAHGGNGYCHTVIEPVMREINIVD